MKVYTYYFSGANKLDIEDTAYVSIAVGNPRFRTKYKITDLKVLKPYGIFGNYHGDEYKRQYFKRLDSYGANNIRQQIIEASEGHHTVLLMCHEKDASVCHRRMFAEWWESRTGEKIEEYGKTSVEAPESAQISLF